MISRISFKALRPIATNICNKKIFFQTTGRRPFSTVKEGAKVEKKTFMQWLKSKSVGIIRVARVARVGFITFSIYILGYQAGLMEYAQNPAKVENKMVVSTIASITDDTKEKGEDGKEKETETFDYNKMRRMKEYPRVKQITNRILEAAREKCRREIRILRKQKDAELTRLALKDKKYPRPSTRETPPNGTSTDSKTTESRTINDILDELEIWEKGYERLDGKWELILINSMQVNAFVSALCPRKVFVCQGLLQTLDLNDDELAMVLGHELSHIILGHSHQTPTLRAMLYGINLMLITFVDPLGISSYFFDIFIGYMRDALDASFEREHEHEADSLGVEIASLACFNVKDGINVMNKLQSLTPTHTQTSILDTHPASVERHVVLQEILSSHELGSKQEDCGSIKEQMKQTGIYQVIFGPGRD